MCVILEISKCLSDEPLMLSVTNEDTTWFMLLDTRALLTFSEKSCFYINKVLKKNMHFVLHFQTNCFSYQLKLLLWRFYQTLVCVFKGVCSFRKVIAQSPHHLSGQVLCRTSKKRHPQ